MYSTLSRNLPVTPMLFNIVTCKTQHYDLHYILVHYTCTSFALWQLWILTIYGHSNKESDGSISWWQQSILGMVYFQDEQSNPRESCAAKFEDIINKTIQCYLNNTIVMATKKLPQNEVQHSRTEDISWDEVQVAAKDSMCDDAGWIKFQTPIVLLYVLWILKSQVNIAIKTAKHIMNIRTVLWKLHL